MLPAAFRKKSKKVVKSAMMAKRATGGKKSAKASPFAERMAALKTKGKFGKYAAA